MKRAIFALVVILATSACGGSSEAPSITPSPASPASFSGLWQGSLKYTSCDGMRHCFARVASSIPFTLRILQTGARVRALFTISNYAVELNGDVRKDASLELTGSSPLASPANPDFDAAVAVQRFSLTLDPMAGLVGSVLYQLHAGRENAEFNLATLGGDIMNVSRSDLPLFASTFDGTWTGRFVVRSCAPIGLYCYALRIDELDTLELRLTQNGTDVNGMFGNVPVTGRVSGRTLTLTGEHLTPSSGGDSLMRITTWNASIDDFGRMSGTFEYVYAFPVPAPQLGSNARAELWQVVKVP
jgi:hypothetical protein